MSNFLGSEIPWKHPDLEKIGKMRDADEAMRNINLAFRVGRSITGCDPINEKVDHANYLKYDLKGGFRSGVLPNQTDSGVSNIESWKRQVLDIDKLPGIPTWRLVEDRYGYLDVVRVGSYTDKWMKDDE